MIAAWLHDVVEDTDVELKEVSDLFGAGVAELVNELTNPSKGSSAPRDQRKALDRNHLTKVSREAKIIKLLDRIDNLSDKTGAPSDFMSTYLEESRLLAEAIGNVDSDLKQELLALTRE